MFIQHFDSILIFVYLTCLKFFEYISFTICSFFTTFTYLFLYILLCNYTFIINYMKYFSVIYIYSSAINNPSNIQLFEQVFQVWWQLQLVWLIESEEKVAECLHSFWYQSIFNHLMLVDYLTKKKIETKRQEQYV